VVDAEAAEVAEAAEAAVAAVVADNRASRLFLGEPAAGTGTAVLGVEGSWPMLGVMNATSATSMQRWIEPEGSE
jgi:hypothetical protein